MSVIPKIPRASGGFAPPPWAPYQGYTLDQLVKVEKTEIGIPETRIQDLWLGGVSMRGVWGPLKVPSWSRV
jgi:hypothetical protein